MDRNVEKNLRDLYRKFAVKFKVYLSESRVKGIAYDKYTDKGYTVTYSNPIWIKAIMKTVSPEKLIYKEMGIGETGGKEIVIKKSDVNALKDAKRIEIEDEEYSLFREGTGSNYQIFKTSFGFYRIILFRRDT